MGKRLIVSIASRSMQAGVSCVGWRVPAGREYLLDQQGGKYRHNG